MPEKIKSLACHERGLHLASYDGLLNRLCMLDACTKQRGWEYSLSKRSKYGCHMWANNFPRKLLGNAFALTSTIHAREKGHYIGQHCLPNNDYAGRGAMGDTTIQGQETPLAVRNTAKDWAGRLSSQQEASHMAPWNLQISTKLYYI